MTERGEPSPDVSQLLHRRMAEIGAQFLARTQQELGALDQLMLQLRAGAASAPLELKQRAHRINGAAAALGFPTLSTHAGNVEGLAATTAAGPVLPETMRAIERELAALGTALKLLRR